MKKFAAIAVAASMFALAACGDDPAPPAPPSGTDQPPTKEIPPKPCNPQKQPGRTCPDIP